MDVRELLDQPVQVVAGKGGVGRTSVALALALRASRAGHKTLLLEVDAPDSATRMLGAKPAVDTPREVENNLWVCRMTPQGSLREYALLVLRFKLLYRLVFENDLVRYFLKSIPSLAEVTMLGKMWWHATQDRRQDGQLRYDRVILDAPATGHAITFLSVARLVANIVPPGPMKSESKRMAQMVEQAILHVVALPEEMPVNEGIDLWKAIPERLNIRPGVAFVNRMRPRSQLAGYVSWTDKIKAGPSEFRIISEATENVLAREKLQEEYQQFYISESHRPSVSIPEIDKNLSDKERLNLIIQFIEEFDSPSGLDHIYESISKQSHVLPKRTKRTTADSALGWSVASLLDEARCIVAVGPGGVGKTSISAALAIEGARRGRRTVVLTIDPAKRLANALGLPEIGSVETIIDPQAFTQRNILAPKAPLSAMMLDIKEAWDDVVRKYHPDPEQREKLLQNRMYHTLSTALAGSQEYMAMEKLYQLAHRETDPPDLIILDTPPAQHALQFLEAPNRILDALNNNATRWLLDAARSRAGGTHRSAWSVASGAGLFYRTLSKITSVELLDDLGDLLSAFSAMFDGFMSRAQAVNQLIVDPSTHFVLVGSPQPNGLSDIKKFTEHLLTHNIQVRGLICNRATPTLSWSNSMHDDFSGWMSAQQAPEDVGVKLLETMEQLVLHRELELERVQKLADNIKPVPVTLVPELPQDVHDLVGLDYLCKYLLGFGDNKS